MNPQEIIETTGSILKVEKLISLENNILPNSLVLKNIRPFPGTSYNLVNIPEGKKMNSYFLILMYRYFPEKIERLTRKFNNEVCVDCNISSGEILINNRIFPCIRLKRLKAPESLTRVQWFFKESDIRLAGAQTIENEGKIKVFKRFKIMEAADYIYRDLYEPHKFYVVLSKKIDWNTLWCATEEIKKSMTNPDFDAALGTISRFNGTEDVIRIFDRDTSLLRALQLRNSYFRILGIEIGSHVVMLH